MPSGDANDHPDDAVTDPAGEGSVAVPAPPAQGLPAVAPDAGEEVFAGEMDNVVPTYGYHQLPVVGLGGSAGGIQALKVFFEALPPGATGMAYVVILHLSPEHESTLPGLLQSATSLPVKAAEDGEQLRLDHVYVIPPRKHLTLTNGHLRLTPLEPTHGKRVAVDLFFRSLADTHGPHAAAVVLSGADSDGAIGIKRVKERGGLTIAQEPGEAEQEGMPRAAIVTGMVDWVLPVADIPARLLRYRSSESQLRLPSEDGPQPAKPAPPTPDQDEQALRDVLILLRTRTDSDFTYYKRATILRRLARRMQINEVTTLPAYLDFLRTHPGETGALLQDLLISVTNFFRDREAFAFVEAQIPSLFAGKGSGDTVRVWSAACATGEEAYSLAMLLSEQARRLEHPPSVQVFGCDLDEQAIQTARAGLYPATIAADVSEDRLARFFTKEPRGYRVRRELRETVLFTQHDLLKDAPFSRMDLISCRNLLIYLDAEAQARALEIFHFALKPDGLLFLGSAESVDEEKALFAPLDKKHCLFVRRAVPRVGLPVPTGTGTLLRAIQAQNRETPVVPPAALVYDVAPSFALPSRLHTSEDQASLAELHFKLTERYAPPSLIVNAEGDIVHLSENVGRFLRPPGGQVTTNFLQMVLPALRMDLRAALLRVGETHAPAEVLNVAVELEEGVSRLVDLRVAPAAELAPGYVLVSFAARAPDASTAIAATGITSLPTDAEAVVRHLERELEAARARLRDTVERSRATEEEYKSSNEELQSMNEELRSASEELETSREELQSLNEELSTVNHELKHNVEEVGHANSDLHNLMNATAIATVFLCRELKVLRYTPSAVPLFNLIPSDTGRPLGHLKHQIDYPELEADARQVLRTLVPVEREVGGPAESWLLARLLPYRSLEDRIEGVVLTLVDVTARKRAEEEAREASARLRAMADTAPVLIWETDASGVVFLNQHYLDFFGRDFEAVRGMGWAEFLHPDDARGYVETYRSAFARGESYEYECRFRRADGEYRWLLNVGRPFGAGHIVGCSVDITENKRAEAVLRESEERQTFLLSLSDRLRTMRDATEIQNYAVRALAQCLDVTRAGYYEFEADPDRFFLVASWEPGAKGLPERMSLADFGDEIREGYLAGRTLFMCDAEQEIASEANRAAHRAIEVRAWIGVPLLKDGCLVAAMGVHSKVPHRWTPAELHLCEDVTQRTWAAVERVRAEEALAKSEEKYRTLFNSIDQGVTSIELLFDEHGHVVDAIYLETNPAVTALTGLSPDFIGKRVKEFAPNLEPFWFETYERVVKTGQSERFEHVSGDVDGWFDVHASRIGGEGSRQLVSVYSNITERKRREAHQTLLVEIGDDLSRLVTPDEIMRAVGERLGEHLKLGTCVFVDVFEERGLVEVHHSWNREGVPSLKQTFRFVDYVTEEFGRASRAGETTVVHDTGNDPRLDAEAYARLKIGATFAVPFRREGRWTAFLAVTNTAPRDWRVDEIELVHNIADRVFPRIERARAEEALRESEARTRALAENLPGGAAFVFDRQLRYVLADGEALRAVGFQSADFLGKTPSEIFGETLTDIYTPHLRAALAGESFVHEHASHGAVFISRGAPLRDPATGEVTGVVVISYDITERKRAEEALRLSEEKYRTLFESMDEGFYFAEAIFDTAGKCVDILYHDENPAAIRMIGQSAKGRRMSDLAPYEQYWRDIFGETARTGREQRREEYAAPDGIWYEFYVFKPSHARDNQFALIFRDVTARRRAANALRTSEEEYRSLFTSIDEGFCTIEIIHDERGEPVDYRFLTANPAFVRFTGLTDAIGHTVREFAPNQEQFWFESYGRVARTGEPMRMEHEAAAFGGIYDVYAFRIGAPEERRVALIFNNITARKRAERALQDSFQEVEHARAQAEAANAAKDHFLAVLSHELRTPLMPINIALAMLDRRRDLPDAVRKVHEMIKRNIELEVSFIADLLDVTRISRGKMEIVCEDMDLHEALERAVEVSSADIEAKTQRLTVTLAATEHRLQGDFSRLQQVFWNLLKNASKFTPEGGSITLRTRNEPGRIVAEVTDSGIGMEAEALARVFQPFEQANVSITREFGGLGLGLAIAKSSVEAHGGTLSASSPGPGQGATFTITLPLTSSQTATETAG